ncbi:MAG: M55 family metallopeptidase [Planctomycetes bacterium]|nr:M55 family metallopeptidase [Planctomycetota bacterium]
MKLFISSDMEGATGVVHIEQLMPKGNGYDIACKWLTSDINAAIEGACDASVDEILVNDGHGIMRNVILNELDSRASLVMGPATYKPLIQLDGLDESFDAVFFIAYHSKVGTTDGLLSHTYVGRTVHEIRLNGKALGESGLNAAVAGHYNVPVVLITGADELGKEIREDLSDEILFVEVKKTFGRETAICLTPSKTHELIKAEAKNAIIKAKTIMPIKVESPITIEVDTHHREMTEKAVRFCTDVKRVGERTFQAVADTVPDAIAAIWKALMAAQLEYPDWLK